MATFVRLILCVVLFAVARGPALAAGEPFDIKGIALGVTPEDIKAKLDGVICSYTPIGVFGGSCSTSATYGGASAHLTFMLAERKVAVAMASFAEQDFDLVVEAMKMRFGKPSKVERRTVQNRMGAKFDNDVVIWTRGDQVMKAERRGSKIDRSLVTLAPVEQTKEVGEHLRKEATKRAGDL